MIVWFTLCYSTIMTTDTSGAANGAVIKHRYQPVHNCMTSIARLRCGDVGGAFADGNDRVMTTLASAQHLVMIDSEYGYPATTAEVAGVADVGGGNVGSWLAGRDGAVMTTGASTQYFVVIHSARCDRYPWGCVYMACIT